MEYSNLVLLTKFINLRLSENLSSVTCYETKSYRTKQQEISLHPTQQGIFVPTRNSHNAFIMVYIFICSQNKFHFTR